MAQKVSLTTLVVLLTALVAIGPVATDLYLPSLPSLGAFFDASVSQTQLTLSAYMVGMAAGTLIYGPVSDRFGRRWPLLAGMSLFTVMCLACAFARTIEELIALRFMAAVGGCASGVLTRAIVRDLFAREDAARIFSYMAGAMALAPALAPIVGGAVHVAFGWRGQFLTLAIIGAGLTLAAGLMLRETNKQMNPAALDPLRLMRSIARLLRHRAFLGYALTSGFSYGALFSFISGGSFVLIDMLGVAPQNFGYCFIFVAGGFFSGGLIGGKLTKRLGILRMIEIGVWIGVGAALLGTSLALMGVMTVPAIVGPVAMVFFSCAFVFPNATAGALAPFAEMAGTASSIVGCIQMGMGASIGAIVGATLTDTSVPLFAVILCATVSGAAAFYTLVRTAERKTRRDQAAPDQAA